MTHAEQIASQLHVKPSQVTAVINLLDDDNTVPFIARYRKEMTGSLDDEQIRIIADELVRLRALDERRAAILASIEEQGKLTDELREHLNAAQTLTILEDLYAPYLASEWQKRGPSDTGCNGHEGRKPFGGAD